MTSTASDVASRVLTRGPLSAELVYARTTQQKPRYYMREPPAGEQRLVGEYAPYGVQIEDGRDTAGEFSLDVHGFALARLPTALSDAYDDAEVRSVYYPEVEQLVLRASGASRVLVFDHNARSGPRARSGQHGVAEPVRLVHNDYTVESARLRVQQLLPAEAAGLLERRHAFINVWRPLFGPVLDTPLAVCDARSIASTDGLAIDLIYSDRVGQNYHFVPSERHRWYYFSEMRAEEALLLKCMDSPSAGRARFTAHTAFDDPRAPRDARPRESIEARTIAFY